jgi:O-glycosyl hydrolase
LETAIDNGLFFAKMIHWDMTIAETNAFLYWWLYWDKASHGGATDDIDQALVHVDGSTVTTPKRLWAIGQFSRFVRPGWYRVGSTTGPTSGVYTSAYRSDTGNDIAVVLINDNTSAKTVSLSLQGATGFAASLKAYRTSSTENLVEVTAPTYTTGGASISGISLPASSVTTLVGKVQ